MLIRRRFIRLMRIEERRAAEWDTGDGSKCPILGNIVDVIV